MALYCVVQAARQGQRQTDRQTERQTEENCQSKLAGWFTACSYLLFLSFEIILLAMLILLLAVGNLWRLLSALERRLMMKVQSIVVS